MLNPARYCVEGAAAEGGDGTPTPAGLSWPLAVTFEVVLGGGCHPSSARRHQPSMSQNALAGDTSLFLHHRPCSTLCRERRAQWACPRQQISTVF